MPRIRNKENMGFPAGWRVLHGAIYFHVPKSVRAQWDDKQLFRLGKTPAEAYRVWADRIGTIEKMPNIGKLLDRYEIEVIPLKAAKTHTEQKRQIKILRKVFGQTALTAIEPRDIYKYVDKHKSKISAKREIAVLSHAFTKACQWGIIKAHPFKGQIRFDGDYSETPRDRYVEDWEIIEAYNLKPVRKGDSVEMVQAYINLKVTTGMSKGDLLRLQPAKDFKEDGIHIKRHKTAKKGNLKTMYAWTPNLRSAVELALAVRPVDISPWLFCNRRGKGYFNEATGTASGFDSIWQRFMARLLKETDLKERFTEHDIRAKAGSDAETDEEARKMLSHATVAMTKRVYRRKPEEVTTK